MQIKKEFGPSSRRKREKKWKINGTMSEIMLWSKQTKRACQAPNEPTIASEASRLDRKSILAQISQSESDSQMNKPRRQSPYKSVTSWAIGTPTKLSY